MAAGPSDWPEVPTVEKCGRESSIIICHHRIPQSIHIRVGKELQNSEKLETAELWLLNFVKHSLCILSENKLLLLQPCKKIVTMGTNKH